MDLLKNGRSYSNLMSDLLLNDGSSFRNFVRLTQSDFEEILCLVAPKISKENTNYRAAIPPSIRLAVTLRYLATSDSFTIIFLRLFTNGNDGAIVAEIDTKSGNIYPFTQPRRQVAIEIARSLMEKVYYRVLGSREVLVQDKILHTDSDVGI
ncbi:hypothetical protein NQ318_020987 [Aromia moschata]|uniref:Uncharacterized protein n=1 Tax=Aromia moschata TaxID=1265417 RepID=A0AAV8YPK0_9CUCU|nr:hypothetical protein NQ318_020987 [Aromia moschata]